MATLPDVPANTVVTVALFIAGGLVALNTHMRTKVDLTVHENYRQAKIVDANVHAGADIPSIHKEQSPRSA